MWKNSPVKGIQNDRKINIENYNKEKEEILNNKIIFPSQLDYQNILEKVSNSLFDDDNDHENSISTTITTITAINNQYENNNNNENNNESTNSFESITTEDNLPEFIDKVDSNILNLPKFEPPPYFHKINHNYEQNIEQMISSIPQHSNRYPTLDLFAQYLTLIEESHPTMHQNQIYPTTLTADNFASQIKNKHREFIQNEIFDENSLNFLDI